jgi:hypothetical protein
VELVAIKSRPTIWKTLLAEDYLCDLLVYESLPVKIFRAAIGQNEEKDMVEL